MQGLTQEIRFELRQWMRKPGFTLIAILTLALGAGANALMFTIIDSVLLRPLPYPDARHLFVLGTSHQNAPSGSTSFPNFQDIQAQAHSFSALAAYDGLSASIRLPDGTAVHSDGLEASASLFDVLKVRPLLGRTFPAGENAPGAGCDAVISSHFWHEHMSSDPNALGQTLVMNGRACAIAGIMPDGFSFPSLETDFILPLQPNPATNGRGTEFLLMIGRMKPAVTTLSAQSELDAIAARLAAAYPAENKGERFVMDSYQDSITGEVGPALLALLGAVGLLLLIACGNIANMQLARALGRKREIAVRAALGATRLRIARQLLIESLLLALVGTGAGLALAAGALEVVKRIARDVVPRARELAMHPEVCLAMLGVASISVLLFGLAPVWQATREDIETALRETAGSVVGGRKQQRLRDVLVIAQLTLAIVLVAGSGLLLHSLYRLLHTDPGFTTEHVLTMQTALSGQEPAKADLAATVYGPELDQIEHLAGVRAAGFITFLPLGQSHAGATFDIVGRAPAKGGLEPRASLNAVSEHYFTAMQIPLLQGRFFSNFDRLNSPRVALVNEDLAKRYFRGKDPIGQRISFGEPDSQAHPITIVGVVRSTRQRGMGIEPEPEIYLDFRQVPPATLWSQFLLQQIMTYVVRATGDPGALSKDIQHVIKGVDAGQTVFHTATMNEIVSASVESRRLGALLLSVFSGLALAVATVGLYGVLSYLVSNRRRDIAIRMALGARREEVIRMVILRALALYAVSVLIGVTAVFGAGRVLSNMLTGVKPWDPTALTGTLFALVLAAVLAAWFPAQRAASIDPYVALRND